MRSVRRIMRLVCAKDGDDGGFDSFLDIHVDGGGGDDVSDDGGEDSIDSGDDDSEDTDSTDSDDLDGSDDGFDDDGDSDDDDSDGDSDDDSTSAQLAALKEQNKLLMNLLTKQMGEKKTDVEPEPAALENPFESEVFTQLAEGMGWDSDEQKLMKNFFQMALDYNKAITIDQASQSIPEIVNSTMTAKEKQQAIHTKFYADNPELEPVKSYVSLIAKEVTGEFKKLGRTLSPEVILAETSKRAYKVLGLKKGKQKAKGDAEPVRGRKPAFASKPGARKIVPKKSSTSKMIEAMIKLDE